MAYDPSLRGERHPALRVALSTITGPRLERNALTGMGDLLVAYKRTSTQLSKDEEVHFRLDKVLRRGLFRDATLR
jgi:hypothetical protein